MNINNSIAVLIKHTQGNSGGSRRCAMFLLSLWNGAKFKANLQEFLYNDSQIFYSMIWMLQQCCGDLNK